MQVVSQSAGLSLLNRRFDLLNQIRLREFKMKNHLEESGLLCRSMFVILLPFTSTISSFFIEFSHLKSDAGFLVFWQHHISLLFIFLCFSLILYLSPPICFCSLIPVPLASPSYTCVTLKWCLCIIICGWSVWVTLPLLSTQTTEVPLSKSLNTQRVPVKLNCGLKQTQIWRDDICNSFVLTVTVWGFMWVW